MKTKVYVLDLEALKDKERFDKFYNEMPAYRKDKIDRVKSEADKRRSLGAGVLLSKALEAEGIETLGPIELTGNGKPYLANYVNLKFNLSHAGERAVCIVSDREVGCDVEYKNSDSLKIAKRFFCPSEVNLLESAKSEEERNDCFLKLWTLKESFIKNTGMGIALPLNEFSFIFDKDKISIEKQVNSLEYSFYSWKVGDYRISCAIEGTEREPELKYVEL